MNWKWIGFLAVALIVIHIPIIGPFFQIANTLIHESAHALTALLMQGKVLRIELFANTAGVTYTLSASRTASILTNLAGYIGSSAAAYGIAVLCSRGRHRLVLWLLVILAAVNAALWVRNPFGIFWLLIFIAVSVYALRRQGSWPVFLTIGLFLFVLAESVTSSFVILLLSLNMPAEAGDAANLARLTSVPTAIWGILFMLQSVVFGILSVRVALRNRPAARGRSAGYAG